MNLEKYINKSIYMWPTLYRDVDHESSRMHVLGHMFLSYGTGMEFHPDGFWTTWEWEDREDQDNLNVNWHLDCEMDELPKNFYEMELWCLDVNNKDIPAFEKELKGHFYYSRAMSRNTVEYIFEGTEDFATDLTERYDADEAKIEYRRTLKKIYEESGKECPKSFVHPRNASCHRRECLRNPRSGLWDASYYTGGYSPYPMCHYSPIAEAIEGEMNSLHMPNRPIKDIRPDWVRGMLDVCRYSLDFFNDPEKYKFDHYHPNSALRGFKESYERDPSEFTKREDWKEGMTIEEYCEQCFERHRQEQIGYFTKFIEMFGEKDEPVRQA